MATMKFKRALTAVRLRELLTYDPLTGVFRWRVDRRGTAFAGTVAGTLSCGYWSIGVDGVIYRAHRLAWLYVYGVWPAGRLDHKDRIFTHNWIENLRPATQSQNCGNQGIQRNNKSGFKGVDFHVKSGLWRARVTKDYKTINLGFYAKAEEAGAVYIQKAKELFGDFAHF